MLSRLLCTVLVAGITVLSGFANADGSSDAAVVLEIRVCEKESRDSKVKILAEPTIAATIGRPFSFKSGGSAKSKTSDREFDVGTQLNGKVERTQAGGVQLDLRISIGSILSPADDQETDLVRTESLDIRTVLRPGEVKRLKYSDSQWCEVRVADLK
jgi:hypothetical protein